MDSLTYRPQTGGLRFRQGQPTQGQWHLKLLLRPELARHRDHLLNCQGNDAMRTDAAPGGSLDSIFLSTWKGQFSPYMFSFRQTIIVCPPQALTPAASTYSP